jgi:hypothetical protein
MFRKPIEYWRPFNVFIVALTTVQELQEAWSPVGCFGARVDENQVFALALPSGVSDNAP